MIRKILTRLFAVFATFTAAGVVGKLLFLAVNAGASAQPVGWTDWIDVVVSGLSMDCCVAGYLTVLPALITLLTALTGWPRRARLFADIYFALASLVLAAAITANTALYAYWGFPLDTTPLFYLATSPSAAMASVTAGQALAGTATVLALAALTFVSCRMAWTRTAFDATPASRRQHTAAVATVLTACALLFLAIRGGFTVSTMNLSRAYFSQNPLLNHAAVNPAFSLLYSATHQHDFSRQFRYFDAAELAEAYAPLEPDTSGEITDTLLATRRPDIVLVIMESFSAHLMPSLGGAQVATRLDSVAADGLLFTRAYASSFRTDRALPAILSGFPGQPTTSVMKSASKIEALPSLARTLRGHGWQPAYYYGGDVNFTNMLAYLVSSGFDRIVCDKDFPLAERTGKWGAHDHLVFARCAADIAATAADAPPQLTVVQTSSSHEPFEVPYRSAQPTRERNAFAYADSCLGAFLDTIATTPRWERTLVVIVPDHYGAWPRNISGPEARHHIPIVMTGGALARRHATVDSVTAQTDLAATLLAQLGIPHGEFTFSKNVFSPRGRKFAFVSDPNTAAIISADSTEAFDIATPGDACRPAKAFLQKLYNRLDSL